MRWNVKKIYLDYAATTPLDPRVRRAMAPYFAERFGNPGSVHWFGQEAMAAVDAARETIARTIGADFREVIFTASATEANNLALRGALRAVMRTHANTTNKTNSGRSHKFADPHYIPRIIIFAIEHESILETARDLERDGTEVVVLPVSREGIVDLGALQQNLDERTILVSVMYANNEIGTIQPIAEIAKIIQEFSDANRSRMSPPTAGSRLPRDKYVAGHANNAKTDSRHSRGFALRSRRLPLLHTDAVQAFQYLDCDADRLGADLMTLSSHKIYGPKGAGALYVRNQESNIKYQKLGSDFIAPIITGGGHEHGLRSGTENVPAIVGCAKAVELAAQVREREARRVTKLRDQLFCEIKKRVPAVVVNGSEARRLPNNLNIRIPGVVAEELLAKLDLRGVAISAGPACAARASKPSHVLRAIGLSDREARECLRITFGRPTTAHEVDRFVKIFVQCL